jgi:hypothetical protein
MNELVQALPYERVAQTPYLESLVSESERVRVAAVIEEGHGGEDGASNRDDVELGDVVVLEDGLGHLEAVGGGDLQVAQQQAGDEDLGPARVLRRRVLVAEEALTNKQQIMRVAFLTAPNKVTYFELEALGHEDGLRRLLDEVLERPLVRVGGEVVDGAVAGGVEDPGEGAAGGGARQRGEVEGGVAVLQHGQHRLVQRVLDQVVHARPSDHSETNGVGINTESVMAEEPYLSARCGILPRYLDGSR